MYNETLMTEHLKEILEAVVQTVEVPELNALKYSAGYVPWNWLCPMELKFSNVWIIIVKNI